METYLTTAQAAERLGVRPVTIRKWVRHWPGAIRLGRDWLIPEPALAWWRERRHTPGRPPATTR